MSKLTTREYKNMVKRPSKRGHGRAVLRNMPEVEAQDHELMDWPSEVDIVDEAEQDLTELELGELEVEASIEDAARSEGKKYETPQALGSIDKGNAL